MTSPSLVFANAISKYAAELDLSQITGSISEPPKPEYGDMAFPCFLLSKHRKKGPHLIASELAASLQEEVASTNLFSSITAEGPFLNLKLNGSAIAEDIINAILGQKQCYGSKKLNGKTIAVDFSSPNIAKHLGVHHLRSTMIGNSICNIYEKLGFNVLRVNYLGDWGTQFGKLMALLNGMNYSIDEMTVELLATTYAGFEARAAAVADYDRDLHEEARAWFKRLEDGDPLATHLWETFRKISIKEFEELYSRLNVSFTEFDGESNYSTAAKLVIEECQQKGIAQTGEGGAVVIPMGENNPPCMLQKSDGATTYLARDVAALINRFKTRGLSKMLYVVGHAQNLHFKQVFHVVKQMGYAFADCCEHVPFGLLKFEGSKFSTRKGNLLLLKDVLDTAGEHVAAISKEKGSDISDKDIDSIGIGAVVFADLSRKRSLDVNFKWDDILQFDGNTGPYLQYTLARCHSILTKSGICETSELPLLSEDKEKLLLLKLSQYSDVLETAAESYDPSQVCNYLLKLAKYTNSYLHSVRVIQSNKALQAARTALVSSIIEVIKQGLALLGIEQLYEM